MPIYNSSGIEFWPILAKPLGFKSKDPFVLAIFCGQGKSRPLSTYLDCFIEEICLLLKQGICFNGFRYNIDLAAVCCDSSARWYLKQIMGHNSKYGCERCVIRTMYDVDGKKKKDITQ